MKREVSGREMSNMLELLHGDKRTSFNEIVWVRPLTPGRKLRAFFGASEEGSQLVEMALMFPILLVLLTGMASFGMALYSQQQLGLATANAVQAAATGASISTANPCQTIETNVSNSLPGWTATSISYSFTVYYLESNGTTVTSTNESWTGTGYSSCSGSTLATELGSSASQFQAAVLTVSYPYKWFPVMSWAGWGSTFKATGNLQSTQAAMIQ
jgi:Flp pilus assembly protein TadG